MVSGGGAWVVAAAVFALSGGLAASASAAPPGFQGEEKGHRGKDARQGSTAPSQRQRDLGGAPRTGDAVPVITFGWSLQDGERRPVTAWGGPRLELGSRYVAPLVRAPRDGAEWTPLSLGATLPLEGDVITTSGIFGLPSPVAKSMSGKTAAALADALARTPPDPIAAKHFDLPPDERWRAVLRERQSR